MAANLVSIVPLVEQEFDDTREKHDALSARVDTLEGRVRILWIAAQENPFLTPYLKEWWGHVATERHTLDSSITDEQKLLELELQKLPEESPVVPNILDQGSQPVPRSSLISAVDDILNRVASLALIDDKSPPSSPAEGQSRKWVESQIGEVLKANKSLTNLLTSRKREYGLEDLLYGGSLRLHMGCTKDVVNGRTSNAQTQRQISLNNSKVTTKASQFSAPRFQLP